MNNNNIEYVKAGKFGLIPVLPLKMMDNEREKQLGRLSAQKWKEVEALHGNR